MIHILALHQNTDSFCWHYIYYDHHSWDNLLNKLTEKEGGKFFFLDLHVYRLHIRDNYIVDKECQCILYNVE